MAYAPMILLFVAAATALPQPQQQDQRAAPPRGAFTCPTRDGYYPDPYQCDKYWECYDDIATEKLCPDGLVFPTYGNPRHERCDFPFNVICEDRLELQAPQTTLHCPRANGFYAHEDPAVCNIFYQCVGGEASETPCPGGLHFDEFAGTCAWPEASDRRGCGDATRVLEDGFSCDHVNKTIQESNGLHLDHLRFQHPTDCQYFYVCLNGKTPRLSGCETGLVYNAVTMACDDPANVPECAHWYDPLDYDYEQGLSKPSEPKAQAKPAGRPGGRN